jgi:hypothetical protein
LKFRSKDYQFCCCRHAHTSECLWLKYLKDAKRAGKEIEAHDIHNRKCKGHNCPKENLIDHHLLCVEYKNFFNSLTWGFNHSEDDKKKNDKLVDDNADREGFLRRPSLVKGQMNLMCCCQSHISHEEASLFVLLG